MPEHNEPQSVRQFLSTTQNVIDQIRADRINAKFFPTGFPAVDRQLDGGFLLQELVVVGGQSALGKSQVAGQMLWHMAQQGIKTAYFSLEISNEMIVSRLLGAIARIKPILIRLEATIPFTQDERTRILEAEAELLNYEAWLAFYDEVYTINQMIEEIKQHQYQFIVIDFIQNIIGGPTDEYSRLSEAALILQKAAKEFNCCILILSQLSNAAAKTAGSGMLEYKGSGSIATVCDLGFVLIRKDINFDQQTHALTSVTLHLQKNRRGISEKDFLLAYDYPGGWITDVTDRTSQPEPPEEKPRKKRKSETEKEDKDDDPGELPF